MHPKQICEDVESLGSKLVLDGEDLYIENPENIYPEAEEVIKSYKERIIQYLKNDYSDKEHAVKQTIDKMLLFMSGAEQDMNEKIRSWLNDDQDAIMMVLQLTIDLHRNGWEDCKAPIDNHETVETKQLSRQIYERAMSYFRGR